VEVSVLFGPDSVLRRFHNTRKAGGRGKWSRTPGKAGGENGALIIENCPLDIQNIITLKDCFYPKIYLFPLKIIYKIFFERFLLFHYFPQ